MDLYEKSLWPFMRIPHCPLWKTFWSSIIPIHLDLLWENPMVLDQKILWSWCIPSMRRHSGPLWENSMDPYEKTLWPSMRIPFVLFGKTLLSSIRSSYGPHWYSMRRVSCSLWEEALVLYEKTFLPSLRTSPARPWEDLLSFFFFVLYEHIFWPTLSIPSVPRCEILIYFYGKSSSLLWEVFYPGLRKKQLLTSYRRRPSGLYEYVLSSVGRLIDPLGKHI